MVKKDDEGDNNSTSDSNNTSTSTSNDSNSTAAISNAFGLNYTFVAQQLKRLEGKEVAGATPRWTMLAQATSEHVNVNASVVVLVINSTQESRMGLGRDWHHRALGQQEAHVSQSLLYQLGVQANMGERITLTIPLADLFSSSVSLLASNQSQLRQQAEVAFFQAIKSRNYTTELTAAQVANLLGLPNNNNNNNNNNNVTTNITIVGSQIPDSVLDQLFNQFFDQFYQVVFDMIVNGFQAEFTVIDGIDDPNGKWSASLGNVAVIESKYLMKLVRTLLPENPVMASAFLQLLGISDQQVDDIENYPIEEHAMSIIIQNSNRLSVYLQKYEQAKLDILSWSNKVSLALGLDFDANFQAELVLSLSITKYLSIFLDQIFTSVSVILIGLAAMLIYSLLIADINEKTFEYGMLRALGLQNRSLIIILTIQALFYALPGIIIGILMAFLAFLPLADLLASFGSLPADYSIDQYALLISILLGLFLPILANIMPIQRVLSRTLRDALDLFSTGESTEVSFIRLNSSTIRFSGPQTSASILMTIIGFVVYYVVPYSFMTLQTSLFLGIMNWILLGMVFGCIVLSTTIQPHLERAVVFLTMWGQERAKLGDLVKKALSGHRVRNRKTALMFTISLSFVIFAGAMFVLQTRALNSNIELLVGSSMLVFAPRSNTPLDELAFRDVIERDVALQRALHQNPRIRGYSFSTFPLFSSYINDLGEMVSQGATIYGVEQNFLHATYAKFYQPTTYYDQFDYTTDPTTSKPDLFASLYQDSRQQRLSSEEYVDDALVLPGTIITNPIPVDDNSTNDSFDPWSAEIFIDYIDVVASEALRPTFEFSPNYPANLWRGGRRFFVKFRGFVKKLPGFYFSSYSQTSWGAPLMVTMDSFVQLSEPSTEQKNPAYQRLFIQTPSDLSDLDRAAVINSLRTCIKDSLTQVIDTTDVMASTSTATSLILVFFNVISMVAILMCFFSLWLSFIANVNENAWEFGVLRAVGLTSFQVVRIYLYEAFALIISAVCISTVLGIAIAATLTLQFDIFSEMAFEFSFPSFLFFTVTTSSIVVAFVGSYLAARTLQSKPIAAALKGL